MKAKHRNLYLYLTLVCFVGIILIFIFDGYMGVYDTLVFQSGEYEQKIEENNWDRDYWSTLVTWGDKAFFTYEVDNRRFSSYTADIEVSVWHSMEKVSDILAQRISVGAFDKEQVEWFVDTAEILPEYISSEQGLEFTMVIKRGEIERRFIIHIRADEIPIKPVPIPTR